MQTSAAGPGQEAPAQDVIVHRRCRGGRRAMRPWDHWIEGVLD
uniref:Uncharacterized protein n=1 Tax=Arundo donax TaxID=35708 RepID=A0A0A8YHZ3_ARUDO